MGKYKRKYRKGGQITSLDALMTQKFVYFFDKITHCGWFGSWQLRLAQSYIKRGMLYYAIPVEMGGENERPSREEEVENG